MKKVILAILFTFAINVNASSQDLIKIINVVHQEDGVTDYQGEFRIPLPSALTGVVNAPDIMKAYQGVFNIIGLDTISLNYYAVFITKPLRMPFFKVVNDITTSTPNMPNDYQAVLESLYAEFQNDLNNFQLMPSDAIIGKKWNGTTWAY